MCNRDNSSLLGSELEALKFLALTETPVSSHGAHPQGQPQAEDRLFFWKILMDNRRRRVVSRLEGEQARRLEESKRSGERTHLPEPISDSEVEEQAREEILVDLMLIKKWMSEGKDPVVEMHNFRER